MAPVPGRGAAGADVDESRRVALSEPVEERREPPACGWGIDQLGAAESVDLVAAQPQLAVFGNHIGVPLGVPAPGLVGVVLFAVALDHNADSLRQKQEE